MEKWEAMSWSALGTLSHLCSSKEPAVSSSKDAEVSSSKEVQIWCSAEVNSRAFSPHAPPPPSPADVSTSGDS
eukprot:evm.model.NODE_34027_length_26255_cov_24.385527.1